MEYKVGDKVECIKADKMDNVCRIANHLRWHIGDKLIVDRIEKEVYGTFLYNKEGQNLNAKRARLVI